MGEVKRGEGERPTGSDRRGWRGGLPPPFSCEVLWNELILGKGHLVNDLSIWKIAN